MDDGAHDLLQAEVEQRLQNNDYPKKLTSENLSKMDAKSQRSRGSKQIS